MKVNITLVTTSTWLVDGPRRRGRSGALTPEDMVGGLRGKSAVVASHPPHEQPTGSSHDVHERRTTKRGFLILEETDYTASPEHRQEDPILRANGQKNS